MELYGGSDMMKWTAETNIKKTPIGHDHPDFGLINHQTDYFISTPYLGDATVL